MLIEFFMSEFLEIFENDSLALWQVELSCVTQKGLLKSWPLSWLWALECGLVGKLTPYKYSWFTWDHTEVGLVPSQTCLWPSEETQPYRRRRQKLERCCHNPRDACEHQNQRKQEGLSLESGEGEWRHEQLGFMFLTSRYTRGYIFLVLNNSVCGI